MFLRRWTYFNIFLILGFGSFALDNLALNKPTEMSTQRTTDSGANRAVDGNTAQTISSASCALTALDRATEAWWRVDLNGTFAISEIKIYLLNTEIYRFRYYSVHFTDELTNWRSSPYCTNDHSDADGPSSSVFRLNCDGKGRHLTIWVNRAADCTSLDTINYCDILQLCEVQVLGCYPGKYSQSCNMTCPVNCRDDICSIDDGKCYECKDGYLGNTCDTECDPGKFGRKCSQVCVGKCRSGKTCSHINGSCPGGCVDGYTGFYCNKTCFDGKYGFDCNETCGNCHGNEPCVHTNGTCVKGCDSGWKGQFCKGACDEGRYGQDCYNVCGNCKNTACDKRNGLCLYGCTVGFKGSLCKTGCAPGEFGENCMNKCSKNCLHKDVCNWKSGVCPRGCDTGWTTGKCTIRCQTGTFGYGCNERCGHCFGDTSCNSNNGHCPHGCANGWIGNMCNTRCIWGKFGLNCSLTCTTCEDGCHHVTGQCLYKDVTTISSPSIEWPIIVSLLCAVVVVLLVIVVIACRRIHRPRTTDGPSNPEARQENQTNTSSNVNMNYEELQTRTTDKREYDSLDNACVAYQNAIEQASM